MIAKSRLWVTRNADARMLTVERACAGDHRVNVVQRALDGPPGLERCLTDLGLRDTLEDVEALHHSLAAPELPAGIAEVWSEGAIELVELPGRGRRTRGVYRGGLWSRAGLGPIAVGAAGTDAPTALARFRAALHAMARERLDEPSLDGTELVIDGRSAGIVGHELLWHAAEAASQVRVELEGLGFRDVPRSDGGLDYRWSDTGHAGRPIALPPALRRDDPALLYLGWNRDGAVSLLRRQRNLVAERLRPTGARAAATTSTAVVLAAGVASASGAAELVLGILSNGDPMRLHLRIPPDSVIGLGAIPGPVSTNVTVCRAAGCSHLISTTCPPMRVSTTRPIHRYVVAA